MNHSPSNRGRTRRTTRGLASTAAVGVGLLFVAAQSLMAIVARAAEPPVAANVSPPPLLPRIDEARSRAAGIRHLSSQRLTLYTDLPKELSVDELPAVFDQAFGQWCDYFGIDPKQYPDWRMTGCLIKDKRRFEAAGLMPPTLPP